MVYFSQHFFPDRKKKTLDYSLVLRKLYHYKGNEKRNLMVLVSVAYMY